MTTTYHSIKVKKASDQKRFTTISSAIARRKAIERSRTSKAIYSSLLSATKAATFIQ